MKMAPGSIIQLLKIFSVQFHVYGLMGHGGHLACFFGLFLSISIFVQAYYNIIIL